MIITYFKVLFRKSIRAAKIGYEIQSPV